MVYPSAAAASQLIGLPSDRLRRLDSASTSVSPALRALTTAQLIAEEIGCKCKDIVVDDRLYASSADDLLAVIHTLDKKLDRVMFVGHNPEFTYLAHWLSREVIDMPTSAVVEFDFDTKASSVVGEAKPAKVVLDFPKK